MIQFSIHRYDGWRKDYARFDSALKTYRLNIADCALSREEISILVLSNTEAEEDIVIKLALKNFGNSYAGVVNCI